MRRTTGAPARSTSRGSTHAKETWRDRAGKELHPHTNYWVGGNTKFYGAALFRLRREDFGELRHAGGISPAWPIGYDELEPYYTEAEHLYQVHGERGADPTEPPASAPYRYPAVSHEPRIQQLSDDWARLGCRPFHVPLGVMLDERNPRQSRCIRCDTCDGHPCLVSAKSDAQVICVDPALQYPNVTLVTGAYVSRLDTDASGREVTTVHVSGTAPRRSTAATSWSSRAARSTRRRCCSARRATGIPAGSPTGPTSWDGTTWATSTRC